MEEICIRGIVRTQNQELNSKVSRVCSLKFVLDVVGGGRGVWMFTPFILYSLAARSSPLSFFQLLSLCVYIFLSLREANE